jgi:hypothetical protein
MCFRHKLGSFFYVSLSERGALVGFFTRWCMLPAYKVTIFLNNQFCNNSKAAAMQLKTLINQ